MEQHVQLLIWDDCSVHGQLSSFGIRERKGASRRTRHVDTKVYFMQAWVMEPGHRIPKVHGDSQQVADCLTPQAAHRRAFCDERRRLEVS